jgi:MOSC domain-containing protein YiiM
MPSDGSSTPEAVPGGVRHPGSDSLRAVTDALAEVDQVRRVVEPTVLAVSKDGEHRFSKVPQDEVTLVAGLGVEGDAHAGVTVQHRSHAAVEPTQPNLRQVHLLASEFLDEARRAGFAVGPGDLGENLLTAGVDLLNLPKDTLLRIGPTAVVRLTGLRNPCAQINGFRSGLLKLAVGRDGAGDVVRRAGVMAVVVDGGTVRPGDRIMLELPEPPHQRLRCV